MRAELQVPTLAYESENEPQIQTVYESLICNEFLEVRTTLPAPAITKPRASSRAPDLSFQLLPVLIRPGQPMATTASLKHNNSYSGIIQGSGRCPQLQTPKEAIQAPWAILIYFASNSPASFPPSQAISANFIIQKIAVREVCQCIGLCYIRGARSVVAPSPSCESQGEDHHGPFQHQLCTPFLPHPCQV